MNNKIYKIMIKFMLNMIIFWIIKYKISYILKDKNIKMSKINNCKSSIKITKNNNNHKINFLYYQKTYQNYKIISY